MACKVGKIIESQESPRLQNVLRSMVEMEQSVLSAAQHVAFTVCSMYCDIPVTVVCVRKRTDALASCCAEIWAEKG